MGVDLFFLLSGFLMVLTTRDFDFTKSYAGKFLIKRFARIWPLYAAVSLVVFMGVFGPNHPSSGTTFNDFLSSLIFIPTDPKVTLTFGMPISVAWTLCFEAYFYLVFGVSLLFGRWRWLAMTIWFAATLIGYPLVTGLFSLQVLAPLPIEGFRYANVAVNPIVWEFILGMVAGAVYCSNFRIRSVPVLRASIMVSVGLILATSYTGISNIHGPIGWGWPVFLLMLSLTLLSKEKNISVPNLAVWLGGISYSLYLTHLIAFSLTWRAVMLLAPKDMGNIAVLLFVAAPVIAVVLAAFIFAAVENPLSNWTRDKLLNIWDRARELVRGSGPIAKTRT